MRFPQPAFPVPVEARASEHSVLFDLINGTLPNQDGALDDTVLCRTPSPSRHWHDHRNRLCASPRQGCSEVRTTCPGFPTPLQPQVLVVAAEGGMFRPTGSPFVPSTGAWDGSRTPSPDRDWQGPPWQVEGAADQRVQMAELEEPTPPPLPPPPLQQHSEGPFRWKVDARKLSSKDKSIPLPPFRLQLDGRTKQFRIFLRAPHTSNQHHGESFLKSKGTGSIEVSCLSNVGDGASAFLDYQVSISSGNGDYPPITSGPIRHDFTQRAHSIPDWNFRAVVEKSSQTFVVMLEILHGR